MTYQITWDEKTRDFLRKLNKPDAQRIVKKVNSIVEDPQHYLESLVGLECYKLRIGDYRVLVDVNESTKNISVLLIGHRREIYQYVQKVGFARKR